MFQILKVNFHDLLSKITWQASISFCGPSSTMLLWTHCWSDIQSGKKSFKNVLFILVKHMPQQAGSYEMNPLSWKEPHSQTTCLCITQALLILLWQSCRYYYPAYNIHAMAHVCKDSVPALTDHWLLDPSLFPHIVVKGI